MRFSPLRSDYFMFYLSPLNHLILSFEVAWMVTFQLQKGTFAEIVVSTVFAVIQVKDIEYLFL